MEIRSLTVSTDELRLGMFVAELDKPWIGTRFPLQGLLIDDRAQIDELRGLCSEVVIDVGRSASDSIAHLSNLVLSMSGAASDADAGRSRRSPGLWHRWQRRLTTMFDKPRADAPAPPPRMAGMPGKVELIAYRDTKSFEQAIGPARQVYRDIEATMQTVMSDLALKREISPEALGEAATELVESVAVNPEAMMWLTRMREQSVRTYMHSVQVAIYMVTLGRHLGFPRDHLKKLCMAGLLLDVGMTRIDNAMLERKGALTDDERAEVRRHVEYGLEILASTPDLDEDVLEAVAQHHERADGSGYPRGLTDAKTSFAGRMAAIADTFAALTANRPYADTLSAFNAMRVLFDGSRKHYSEPLVEQFVQAIGLFPVGSLVELSSGEVAAVVSHNKVRRLKPRVLIVTDADKKALAAPAEINLLRDPKGADGAPLRIWRGLPAGAFGLNPRDYFLS